MSTKPKLTTGEEANRFIEKVREKYLSKGDIFPLQDKTVTENGEVKADSEYYGLDTVTVNVQPELEDKTITANGEYTSEKYGFGTVTVDVPQETPVMEPTTVISTGTEQIINPPSGVTGFSKVTVNPIDLEDKTITANGVYTSETKSGFGEVTVNVGSIPLATAYRNKISISAAEMTELLDGATTVPDFMFCQDKNLVSIDIPEGVTTIGRNAFENCTSLVHVGLPNTLTTLGQNCFYYCSSLIDMQLPANFVYQAGFNIFFNVPAIEELKFFAGNDSTLTIDRKNINGAIFAKTWRFTEGITELYFFPDDYGQSSKGYTPTEIILPSTLTKIKFFNPNLSYNLPLLTIPDSVTTINTNALTVRDICAISLPANITSTNVPIFSPGFIQEIQFKEIFVRGNSSCPTATLLNNHTTDQLYHAKITYLGE